MELLDEMQALTYGNLYVSVEATAKLKAIIAVHDTRLGPALGGCRFAAYPDQNSAIRDAMRLARGMTFKAALARLPHGGGKSVILLPDGEFDREQLFKAFGRMINRLSGQYYSAEDSGTTTADMLAIRSETPYVTGIDSQHGGSGDPSPFTALGVRRGIEACMRFINGSDSLEGIRVAIQGVGAVGYHLAKELHALGANLVVADTNKERCHKVVEEFGASMLGVDEITKTACDVFSPCALGGAINDLSVEQIKCKVVAGAANNQLATADQGNQLKRRGILYAPDYAINAGGLINVAQELKTYDEGIVRERTMKIYDTIWEILERAKKEDRSSDEIADRMAQARLEEVHS
ncbi:MAG: Glu/Leu/Phe/Val dehydrogenase [Myxococcales bacterium]|nr:MAG: Glu/Leu/Phe/Val dehydrogenase [Myxococcales bacterium]